MKSAWLIFATVCAASCSVVVGLDLGPMIWAAQCQSECLRHFTNYQLIMPSVLQDFKEVVNIAAWSEVHDPIYPRGDL